MKFKAGIVGLGAIGSAMLRVAGQDTIGIEVNPETRERCSWWAGEHRVFESHEVVGECELVFVCVGTPHNETGTDHDLSQIRGVFETLRPHMNPASLLVVRSTVLPEHLPTDFPCPVLVNPEFLREATAAADIIDPPFVVVGTPRTGMAGPVFDWYDSVKVMRSAPKLELSIPNAILLKFTCNWWHATKVEFANMVAEVAALSGADGRKVMEAFALDQKLNLSRAYLTPGGAYGGRCLPKDVSAGIAGYDGKADVSLLKAVQAANDRRRARG